MILVGPLSAAVSADPIDATVLAALAAPCQTTPARFQAYFGDDVTEIAAEIEGVDAWADMTTVAVADGELIGWLLAEYDDEVGRVWWWGPVVADGHDWLGVGERLLDTAMEGSPGRSDEFEFAVDARHTDAAALAERRGYRRGPGSVLLRLDLLEPRSRRRTPTPHAVVAPDETLAVGLAALHDELFPHAYLTGTQVVESALDDVVLVVTADDDPQVVVGYVRAELQPGGGGYVDFLGVAAAHRNVGLGRALVERAVADLAERGATDVSLTVREDNAPARSLYGRLGFDGSRILVPFRLGFTP